MQKKKYSGDNQGPLSIAAADLSLHLFVAAVSGTGARFCSFYQRRGL